MSATKLTFFKIVHPAIRHMRLALLAYLKTKIFAKLLVSHSCGVQGGGQDRRVGRGTVNDKKICLLFM